MTIRRFLCLSALVAVGSALGCSNDSPSATPTTLIACDDGTADLTCCPGDVTPGGACDPAGPLHCRTKCGSPSAVYGHLVCSEGKWNPGLGLFPCTIVDAASSDVDAR